MSSFQFSYSTINAGHNLEEVKKKKKGSLRLSLRDVDSENPCVPEKACAGYPREARR